VLFEFLSGEHIEHPDMHHWRQLIQQAAELQQLTQEFSSPYTPHRINYTPDVCRSLAQAEIRKLKTQNAREKFAWLSDELNTLDLPSSLPKGICHGDFHFSNVLFHNNEFVALLDFDDANQTFLQFDLVGLIEYWAWPHRSNSLDLSKARWVVQEYMKHRPLPFIEQQHLYDVYKLSIFFDCIWYFQRGTADNCYERRKIDALNSLGRQRFFEALFSQ
jgi:Ser/Thr protein kinase RdoA (MazF antagonist)